MSRLGYITGCVLSVSLSLAAFSQDVDGNYVSSVEISGVNQEQITVDLGVMSDFDQR